MEGLNVGEQDLLTYKKLGDIINNNAPSFLIYEVKYRSQIKQNVCILNGFKFDFVSRLLLP